MTEEAIATALTLAPAVLPLTGAAASAVLNTCKRRHWHMTTRAASPRYIGVAALRSQAGLIIDGRRGGSQRGTGSGQEGQGEGEEVQVGRP